MLARASAGPHRVVFAVLLLAVVLLAHLPALSAKFTYDDQAYVVENRGIRSLGRAIRAFGEPWPSPYKAWQALYRPVVQLSYALDYKIAGLEPFAFHLTNVLLYWLTLLFAAAVARHYLAGAWAPLLATLLFALHPAHCEAVDSVTGRSELLALFWGLASWYALLRAGREGVARPRAWLAFATVSYALAALSKENGVMFAGVFFAHIYCTSKDGADDGGKQDGGRVVATWRRYRSLVPIFVVAVSYMLLRGWALQGNLVVPSVSRVGGSSVAQQINTIGAVFSEYMRIFTCPTVLQPDPYYAATIGAQGTTPTFQSVLGLVLIVLLLSFAGLWCRKPTAGDRRLAFFIFAFFILYFPVSHVLPIGALMGERLFYAPSFPLLLLVASLGQNHAALQRRRSRQVVAVLCAAVLVGFAWRSHVRAADWHDSITLWRSALAYVQHTHVYNNLGNAYLKRGGEDDLLRAERLLTRAYQVDPKNPEPYANLATLYGRRGEKQRALQFQRKAFALAPRDRAIVNNLALLHLDLKQFKPAEVAFRRLVRLDPRSQSGWVNLGALAAQDHRLIDARRYYRRALTLAPGDAALRQRVARIARSIASASQIVAELGPRLEALQTTGELRRLGGACVEMGNYRCATRCVQRIAALEGRPGARP